eukprot:s90_g13.t1
MLRVDADVDVKEHVSCQMTHDAHEVVAVGVPYDFLQQAIRAGHPRSIAIHLSTMVQQVLRKKFGKNGYMLAKERANFLRKWSNRAKELANGEAEFHANMAPHLRHLLQGKRLLKEVLQDLEYRDKEIANEIAACFALHGWMTESHVLPKETERPEYTLDMVRSMAKGLNQMIFAQVNSTEDKELSRATWENTLEEVEKQWVWRYVTSDVSDVILAKRFGLEQKSKVRVIDDCSIGGYNKAYGTKEKLGVHAIDQLAAYLSWLCTEMSDELDNEVVGRTYDLRSAYKKFGVSSETRDLLRIMVWDVEQGQPCLLGLNALPFGASGSVNAFLRISMALWFVGTVGLRMCWTVFYDDFTLVCEKRLSHGTAVAAEALFDLFGMRYAKEGSKAVEFDSSQDSRSLGKAGKCEAGFHGGTYRGAP